MMITAMELLELAVEIKLCGEALSGLSLSTLT